MQRSKRESWSKVRVGIQVTGNYKKAGSQDKERTFPSCTQMEGYNIKTDYRLEGKHINDRKMTKLSIKNVAN